MKKLFYIISAALLLFAGCSKDIQDTAVIGEPLPEGTMVKATFAVSFPKEAVVETRALEETPDLENLYVAIFGSSELQYWIPATLKSKPSDSNPYVAETEYVYEVELPLTNSPLQIHFIGNVPQKYTPANAGGAEIPAFGNSSEEKVLNLMISEDMKGGYWQKVKVDHIKATKSGSNIVFDFGSASLDHIALVRNFAKLKYQVTDKIAFHKEFRLLSYTLINKPTMGYIAPWQSGLRYDNRYTAIAGATELYSQLLQDGYGGYTPAGSIETSKSVAVQPERTGETALDDVFMYERPVPDAANQTAVIAKIQWKPLWNEATMGPQDNPREGYNPDDYILPKDANGDDNPNYANGVAGNTYYYKIELCDSDDQYFPILRNFYYVVKLESLVGPGSSSYQKALEGPYFGNVSSSMEAANLTEISDTQTKLTVNTTDILKLAGEEPNAEITFKYYPDASASSYVTTAYTTVPTSTDPYVYVEVLSVKSSSGVTYESAIAKKTVDGKLVDDISIDSSTGKITAKLVSAPESGYCRSRIRLTGVTAGKRKLYREVTITVMPKQDFTNTTSITPGSDGNKYTLHIGLPSELSYYIFPLYFKIEAEYNNLSTNDPLLPVQFGPSVWTENKNSFYFVRTVTWAEYCKIENGQYAYYDPADCELFATDDRDVNVKITNFKDNGDGTITDDLYFNRWSNN